MHSLLALAEELEIFILDRIAGAHSVEKYGGTLYTLYPEDKSAQFCGVFIHKEHVQLSFSQGSSLNDPLSLLKGGGKYRRHVNFKESADLDWNALGSLLDAAVQWSLNNTS